MVERDRIGEALDSLAGDTSRRGFLARVGSGLLAATAGGVVAKTCTETGKRYGFDSRLQGAWYRCCGGTVRKLWDCCAHHDRRINGDAALHGYCYGDRKVFCVTYYQTHVPC